MATINEIKQQAAAVKNATKVGENTAERVGGALAGLADIAEQQDSKLSGLLPLTDVDIINVENKIGGFYRVVNNKPYLDNSSMTSIYAKISITAGVYVVKANPSSNRRIIITDENDNILQILGGNDEYIEYNITVLDNSYIYASSKSNEYPIKVKSISGITKKMAQRLSLVNANYNFAGMIMKPLNSDSVVIAEKEDLSIDVIFNRTTYTIFGASGNYEVIKISSSNNSFNIQNSYSLIYNNKTKNIEVVNYSDLNVYDDGTVILLNNENGKVVSGLLCQHYILSNAIPFSKTNNDFCKIFDNIICIGDSVTDGAIYDYPRSDVNGTIVRKYSYPTQLAKMINCEIENAGFSGISASDWYNKKFTNYDFTKYDLAIIELGYNGGLKLSEINTEGSNANSYKKIIEGIKSQNTNIQIILVISTQFNKERVEVVQKLSDLYSLPIIDLRKNKYDNLDNINYHGYDNIEMTDISYWHFNRIGYLAKANVIYKELISYTVSNLKHLNDLLGIRKDL